MNSLVKVVMVVVVIAVLGFIVFGSVERSTQVKANEEKAINPVTNEEYPQELGSQD